MARRATSLTKKPTAAAETAPAAVPEQTAAVAPRRGKKSKPRDPSPAEMSVAEAVVPGGDEPPAETAAPPAKARRSRKPAPEPSPVADEAPAAAASAAARWDATTGAATFDWPAIEQVAATDGPNQAMAKLLLAARAEGANSRWPF